MSFDFIKSFDFLGVTPFKFKNYGQSFRSGFTDDTGEEWEITGGWISAESSISSVAHYYGMDPGPTLRQLYAQFGRQLIQRAVSPYFILTRGSDGQNFYGADNEDFDPNAAKYTREIFATVGAFVRETLPDYDAVVVAGIGRGRGMLYDRMLRHYAPSDMVRKGSAKIPPATYIVFSKDRVSASDHLTAILRHRSPQKDGI